MMAVPMGSWTDDILRPILDSMASGKIFNNLDITYLLRNPEAEQLEVWLFVKGIADALISSLAAVVSAVMCSIELQRVTLMTEGDGETRLKRIAFTLVKYGAVWAIFHKAPDLLVAIWGIGNDAAQYVSNNLAAGSGAVSLAEQQQLFLDGVKDLDWLGQTLLVVLMLIAWLINKGAVFGCVALAVVRLVKIYIFTAWCPVPMAMLASEHGRAVGIGFLRNYASTVLQAFVLLLAFGIYGLLTSGWAAEIAKMDMSDQVGTALSIGGVYIFMGIVLCMIVMGSGKLASELVGG